MDLQADGIQRTLMVATGITLGAMVSNSKSQGYILSHSTSFFPACSSHTLHVTSDTILEKRDIASGNQLESVAFPFMDERKNLVSIV